MKNKNLIYIGIGVFVIILILSIITNSIQNTNNNLDLSQYRSEEIPEECRLPEDEDNVEWWKQHLSHHEETLYCLDYYN